MIDYPWPKLQINRSANVFVKDLFRIEFNDTAHASRRMKLDGCRQVPSLYFRLTIELSLNAMLLVGGDFEHVVEPLLWGCKAENQG